MKLLLNNKDIEDLINESYEGIITIKTGSEISIELEVDMAIFLKKKIKTGAMVAKPKEDKPVDIQKKNKLAVKQGTMASGGVERTIVNMG